MYPLVTAEWLNQHLGRTDVVILDASISLAPTPVPHSEYIPGAKIMDIDGAFSDPNSDVPHTMISESECERQLRALGINDDSIVIIYDNQGIYSAPRGWWMLKSMGLPNVAVLDGGLPAWQAHGFPTVARPSAPAEPGTVTTRFQPDYFVTAQHVLSLLDDAPPPPPSSTRAPTNDSSVLHPNLAKGSAPDTCPAPSTSLLRLSKATT